ncbi:MAG: NAD(P)H-binding protein [Burkholderiales bacterium]|nr:NAD(P)H-binding protein [Burkholderiales bacterium]
MRVAVIGATGVLGRRVLPALAARGYGVVAIARDPGRVQARDGRIRAVRGDILEPADRAEENAPLARAPNLASAADMETPVRAAPPDRVILRGGLFHGPGTGHRAATMRRSCTSKTGPRRSFSLRSRASHARRSTSSTMRR